MNLFSLAYSFFLVSGIGDFPMHKCQRIGKPNDRGSILVP